MITRRERATLLGIVVPLGLAVLCVLPYLQTRSTVAGASVILTACAYIAGAALTAPIHPNRK